MNSICIQELSFRLNSDNKGNIVGKSIVVASQCGEVGRFSQDSNIEFADNKIIVSDLNNSRIQIIEDGELNVLDYTTFSSPSEDNLKNLNTSILVNNILYFTSYNTSNTQQNLFAYNLDTNKLETLNQTSSIARIFDATSHSDKIYYLSSNGMFVLDTTKSTNNIKMLNPVVYSNTSRISCTDNNIIVANNKSINIYSFDGEVLSTLNISETIADIACNNSNIFTLCSENSSIMKFSISNNELSNTSETLSLNTNDSQYVTMTIDNATGIIYLFDNTDCKIDKVINPTFNFLANRGVFQANNKNVCIYDRPYFLNGIDTPNIIDKLNVNSRVNIYSTTSINYGNIEYYIMELPDGKYGYINRNDLTYLSNIINYEVIHPNATLRSFEDNATITVYSLPDTDSEIIATTDNGTRILIIDELSTDKFIYVKYYDANQNIIQGYVEANLVNHDDITEQQKIAIILAISSIVLLIIISIIITVIYKKKHTKK